MPAAAKLQATFSSWKEVGENVHLVATPGSAWGSNPWDLDLGVAAPGTM